MNGFFFFLNVFITKAFLSLFCIWFSVFGIWRVFFFLLSVCLL